MTLHSIGPTNMAEDEEKIGSGYQQWMSFLYGAILFFVASRWELKWVVAVGVTILAVQLHEAGGRLHDLCIRVRRTNILLRDRFRSAVIDE